MRMYCLDTNALVEPWNKYYTMKRCPEYWDILDQLARQQVIFCTSEVKRDIEKTDDELTKWVQAREYLFWEVTDEVNKAIRSVLGSFPRLIDSSKGRSISDPWVIAHAMVVGAVVVTKELPAGASSDRVKIPDVCGVFGIEWMNDFDFIDEVGIRLSARLG